MRVLVVDSHKLFRQGLVELLSGQPDIEVASEACDSWEAVTEARRFNPDLVIIEPWMISGNGMEALKKIREEIPRAKILVLTVSEEEGDLSRAFNIGVQGYLVKNTTPEHLFHAIGDVMKGETAISPTLAGKVLREQLSMKRAEEEYHYETLTTREREILLLLKTGVSDKEISSDLYLSTSTVRYHVHNILRKLHLKNRVQAAMYVKNHEPYMSFKGEVVG